LLGHRDPRDTGTVLETLTTPADLAAQLDEVAAQYEALRSDRQRWAEQVDEDREDVERLAPETNLPDAEALTPLSDVVTALTAPESAANRLRAAREEVVTARQRCRQALLDAGALRPDTDPPTPPGETETSEAARSLNAATSGLDRCGERLREAEAALEQRQQRRHELENARSIDPVTLLEHRQERDRLWLEITAAWLSQTPCPDPGALADAFADRVRAADEIADQLIVQAQLDADLTSAQREVDDAGKLLAARAAEHQHAARELDAERARWQARWSALGVSVPDPDHAVGVQQALHAASSAAVDADAAEETAGHATPEVVGWTARLRELLGAHLLPPAVPVIDPVSDPLAVLDQLLTVANALIRDVDSAREQQERRRSAQRALQRSQARLHGSEDALAAWQTRWTALLHAGSLPEVLDATGWAERRQLLASAQEAHGEAVELDTEACTALQDWETYRACVTELGTRHGLSGGAEDVVGELRRRLEASRADRRTHQERTEAIADSDRRLIELSDSRTVTEVELEELRARHGLPDRAAVATAADRGRDLVQLGETESGLMDRLRAAVDPEHDPKDLLIELADVDQAILTVRAEQADEALAEAQRTRTDLSQQLGAAKKTLAELLQRGDSADLYARAQEALASVAEIAEEYAVLHLQREVLREALEADAAKHASPLLRTAGRILERLTGGRWVALQAEDEGDRGQRVRIVDYEGEPQALNALSEGTADQVFLALRLAGIAHRQDERTRNGQAPVPVVLDDVLMAFDDERTGYALRTLADMAAGNETNGARMQIVLFTHHNHLAELAERAGHGEVRVVHLEDRPTPSRTFRRS
jgi:hypothetical protein